MNPSKKLSCKAVIGLGFGDEGKGATVHSLCRQSLNDTLVVRYSGGQQAGHTVVSAKHTHVFSNFGSGTLIGYPTYWSPYCTFDPVGFMREWALLKVRTEYEPIIFVHNDCPVTTPYDKLDNTTSREMIKNGTCGVGVGSTFQRQADMYSLTIRDLYYPEVLERKLALIMYYYDKGVPHMEEFEWAVKEIQKHITPTDTMPEHDDVIFEGSQGLMLDQDIGFFPHVTRSNVGSKNILTFDCVNPHELEYYLVTRCYQTRHGHGPRTNVGLDPHIRHNEWETNTHNIHQGHFKSSVLDLTLLKYAMQNDVGIRTSSRKTLVVTCCDLIVKEWQFTIDGKLCMGNRERTERILKEYLDVQKVVFVSDPRGIT